jgi:formate dehydrogenase major subunit
MAEAHPVGFQWVMEAKARGATVIHVDPRFTRTSAVADLHVPFRAGADIAFLGGLINYVLTEGKDFREYVMAFTNAAELVGEDFVDTEDMAGIFSGYNAETGRYDPISWQLEGVEYEAPAAGMRDHWEPELREQSGGQTEQGELREHHAAMASDTGGGAGDAAHATAAPQRDDTLQHPRCVYQVLKRHYSRYTPEAVSRVCGMSVKEFLAVARAITENSRRDRTTAWVYSVGWTHHSVGAQYIRGAAILQTLLGNMGRPGGGILALRGHASIQGSTDIPTLYDLLPGYIPMPNAHLHSDLRSFLDADAAKTGFWGNMDTYMVSLLKAWWGDAATAENDFAFDYMPRLTGDHGTYGIVRDQIDKKTYGYFVVGENPAVGHANGKMQRLGLANLEWLVVRDMQMIETATFWKDGPEIETEELRTEDIGTEVFFLPCANHTEKAGTFTNTQRLLQWRREAVHPPGDARSELHFYFHLGKKIREKLAGSTDERDRPLLDLTWDYPTFGVHEEPDPESVLGEINGYDAEGNPLSSYTQLEADGSTTAGCWIYTGVFADGVNQADRRKPGNEQDWVAAEWGWAWPANRRTLYNRASADAEGRPWSERKAYVWWDAEQEKWTGHDVPDFEATKPPSYVPEEGATRQDALSGTDAFIMQTDGKAWLYAPAGLADGPMPTHYEPVESPVANLLHDQQDNPALERIDRAWNRINPAQSEVYPHVFLTYRLTEHHTAGGMSRFLGYLSELQPEFFCEVSPALAAERNLEHLGWATLISARTAIEARVLVTERMKPLRIGDQTVHQIGLPYHWGSNGLSTGDPANDLLGVVMDPNVHIQESKVATCDIQPGRRPRGPALLDFVESYRRKAGVEPGGNS